MPFSLYTSLVLVLGIVLWVYVPFRLEWMSRFWGDSALSPIFSDSFGLGMWGLEIAFIAYPCLCMIRKARRMRSPTASFALPTLAVVWAGVGIVLLTFNGIFRVMGLEVVSVGNLISTCLFMVTIYFFRQTSLLESLFEVTIAPPTERVSTDPFAKSFGFGHADIANKKMLFEFDASVNYGVHVKNFVDEALGNMEVVILFTRKGSWIHSALGGHEGVRFFLLTPQISYPKQGDLETEMLLPTNDTSIVANALDKALKASLGRPVSIVYDNISEMVILLGMEKTYSFLTIALEILSRTETRAVFLINPRAHDAQVVSAIRGLFEIHLVQEQAIVKIAKAA